MRLVACIAVRMNQATVALSLRIGANNSSQPGHGTCSIDVVRVAGLGLWFTLLDKPAVPH